MNYLRRRLKSGAWIGLAGLVSTVFLLVIENISSFELSEATQAVIVIILTAAVSQITKYLNTEKADRI